MQVSQIHVHACRAVCMYVCMYATMLVCFYSRDLYGAVTDPLLVTRTIVTGSNVALVHRLLYILTYFIRCSEIEPNSLFEVKKSLFEDSDKNRDSRAASTVTVTDDASTNSLRISQSTDLPFIKPHPFSFNRNSVSSSLRSTDSIPDIPRVGSNQDSGSVPSTSSFRLQSDLQKVHKDVLPHGSLCWNNDGKQIPADYTMGDVKRSLNGQKPTMLSSSSNPATGKCTTGTCIDGDSPLYCTAPKCVRSIGSNDSWHSEQATDSGRFSDTELNQRCKDFMFSGSSVFPHPPAHSLPPLHYTNNNNNTLYSAVSHDKLHQLLSNDDRQACDPHILPGIKVTTTSNRGIEQCNSNDTVQSCHNPTTAAHITNSHALSPLTCTSLNHCSSSPNMGGGSRTLTSSPITLRNKSWTGLPFIEGVFSESEVVDESLHEDMEDFDEDNPMTLKVRLYYNNLDNYCIYFPNRLIM